MPAAVSGIALVDKPAGLTSHDVVARSRRLLGTRKVGHAGTLDPMATGLLLLGVGSATRLLTYVVGLDKRYTATVRLGAASDTDDAEGILGEPAAASALDAIDDADLLAAIGALTGEISQRPSTYSAIKVDGRRAYALARAGEAVELKERRVVVSGFELDAVRRRPDSIDLDVSIACSSGTYVRALARDLGDRLAVGGHLTVLRRTAIGPFSVADAADLDELLPAALIRPADAASRLFDVLDLTQTEAVDLAQGKRIPIERNGGPLAATDPDGRLVGLVESVGGTARVLVNFPPDAAAPAAPLDDGRAQP